MRCYGLQPPSPLSQWSPVQPLKVGMTTKLTTEIRTMRSRVSVTLNIINYAPKICNTIRR